MQVLRALEEGAPESVVRKACHLSWEQLRRWRAAPLIGESAPVADAHVLSVIDSAAPLPVSAAEGIEIRVGPWLLSVSRQPE